MRAIKVVFAGYRRLRDTSCNTDGKLIAFLGPNEAGKSSVLTALEWFSNGVGPLPTTDRYRPQKPGDDVNIISVKYRLSDDDHNAISDLGLATGTVPGSITVTKTAGGVRQIDSWSPDVTRDPAPFERARRALADVSSFLGEHGDLAANDGSFAQILPQLAAADAALGSPEATWGDEVPGGLAELERVLRELTTQQADDDAQIRTELFIDAADSVAVAAEVHASDHPSDAIGDLLLRRCPSFILFTDADRDLRATYTLSDDALRAQPPAALKNLLTVAGSSTDELWAAMANGDRTVFRSLESTMNANLRSRIVTSWRQSRLTLTIIMNTDGQLEVLIEELDAQQSASPVVDFGERSDGLRTFMALNCFLGARDRSLPPILLIDEAEIHLHYDAQADLLSLLLQDAEISQVFYTTHSPGCLPPDLGTGLRFVARSETDPRDSILENSFWAKSTPGFSRLLFAMGAGAAAFSAFRRAVLCEGATEMILLPTLLRVANDDAIIDFQVAPGLANANSIDPSLREIAIHTAFVIDGDASGDERRETLKQAGYPESAVLQLPPGKAVEDLLDRDSYLDVVDELMNESGQDAPVDRPALDTSLTVAKAVDVWGAATSTKIPSHVIVAARLAAEPGRIVLSADGRATLQTLYADILAALQTLP